MKQILLSVLLTVVAATAALAQSESKAAPSQQSVEGHLIELERQMSAALVREDAAVLDRLWSNDLVFTFPNGKVSNKAQRLAGQKPAAQPSQSESETSNDEVKVGCTPFVRQKVKTLPRPSEETCCLRLDRC